MYAKCHRRLSKSPGRVRIQPVTLQHWGPLLEPVVTALHIHEKTVDPPRLNPTTTDESQRTCVLGSSCRVLHMTCIGGLAPLRRRRQGTPDDGRRPGTRRSPRGQCPTPSTASAGRLSYRAAGCCPGRPSAAAARQSPGVPLWRWWHQPCQHLQQQSALCIPRVWTRSSVVTVDDSAALSSSPPGCAVLLLAYSAHRCVEM